ncbi:MAG: ABC transporter ATP-binding protein [Clostridia bacterium]|nr:ABC transporter ATP-binding protein [Clostridia bacterium]MBP3649482.1 ABC transporter ATP-binding protein [Clostridia bacterium]
MSNTPILQVKDLCKDYGTGMVLHNLNLSVEAGEFLTLLGPSGCGKTTTLRIIAGLEEATQGSVWLEGEDMSHLPPEKRPVNTVFQSYALFPHMNVAQNIAYGLKLKGIKKAEQKERVAEALALVRLEGYEKRMPTQLSGGQRQRVAIARAAVLKPRVLLLDEPLGALDLKLRQEMQVELKRLQQQLGITFIYITHDQEEALNMSSRIVVMRDGKVEQIGTPEEIYEHPATLFVAGFIGQSNLIHGTVDDCTEDGMLTLNVNGLLLPAFAGNGYRPSSGEKAVVCLRPQRVRYGSEPQHDMTLKGTILSKTYTGGMQNTQIALSDSLTINAVSQSSEMDTFPVGCEVYVGWNSQHTPAVPEESVREAMA